MLPPDVYTTPVGAPVPVPATLKAPGAVKVMVTLACRFTFNGGCVVVSTVPRLIFAELVLTELAAVRIGAAAAMVLGSVKATLISRAPLRVGKIKNRSPLFGVPLVHIRFSSPDEGERPVFGWLAAGDRAYGLLFAWGGYAVAPFSIGAIAIGLFAIGTLSVGVISLGTAGVGSGSHFIAEKFRVSAGLEAVHVPFKGAPDMVREIIGNRIDFAFANLGSALPMIEANEVRAVAVAQSSSDSHNEGMNQQTPTPTTTTTTTTPPPTQALT